MSSYIITFPKSGGIITHTNTEENNINNLPEDFETFETKQEYQTRLDEIRKKEE